MSDKYLTDLYEYIGADKEQNLIKKISDLFGVDAETVSKVISYIDFSDYVELTNAVNGGDKDRIEYILGKKLVPEGANSYSTNTSSSNSFATTQQPSTTTNDQPQQDKDNKSQFSVDVTDKIEDGSDDKTVNPDEEGIEEEIERLKQLSGIEEKQAKVTASKFGSSPRHCGASAGVMMSHNKLLNLTKTKKDTKPGPKTK